jgi:5-methylcytosine-specific restriction endonuclease McrA
MSAKRHTPRNPKRVASIRNRMVAMYGRSCWLCGKPIAYGDTISIDHVRPRSKGGSSKIHNLRPAHVRCNGARGCSDPPELLLTPDMQLKELCDATG